MLKLLPHADHVLAMRLSGQIGKADVEAAIEQLEKAWSKHDRIAVYAEITELEGITFEALRADLSYGLGMLGQLHRIAGGAVVADQDWIKSMARLESLFIPGMEIRTFSLDQRDEAMKWVEKLPMSGDAPAEPPAGELASPSLRIIEAPRQGLHGFEIDGHITADDIDRIAPAIERMLAGENKLRLLARIKDIKGIDPGAVLKDATISMKLKGLRKVERYAIVGAPDWMGSLVRAAAALTGIEMKLFELNEEEKAWAWLSEDLQNPPVTQRP